MSADKRFHDLVSRLAFNGWSGWRSDPTDGHQRFFAARLDRVLVLASLDELEQFLERLGH